MLGDFGRYYFIDGGCLRAIVAGISEELTGNRDELSLIFSDLATDADKIFYYDAVSAQEHNESLSDYRNRVDSEYQRFDAIQALSRFHVVLGEIKGRPRRQKRVDVHLAVDMLTHTFRGNMREATLLAGDDDFIPLVQALIREGLTVTVWHPPQATPEFLAAADNRRAFNLASAYMLLTRDGTTPVFEQAGVIAGHTPKLVRPSPAVRWEKSGADFAAEWDGELLTIWRFDGENRYQRFGLRARGSPPPNGSSGISRHAWIGCSFQCRHRT
jgi:uncharacterized LabA/DUF88 family protein